VRQNGNKGSQVGGFPAKFPFEGVFDYLIGIQEIMNIVEKAGKQGIRLATILL
jgi:hypothetical protein